MQVSHDIYVLLSFSIIYNFIHFDLQSDNISRLPLSVILCNNTFEYRHSICDIVSKIYYVINEPGTT